MTKAELFTWYFDQKQKIGIMFSAGKITKPEYNQLVDKLDKQLNDASDLIDQGKEPKLTNVGNTAAAAGTPGTMTPEEYKAAKSAMYQKYKAGEITNYAYIQWKKKNDPALKGQNGVVSAASGKGGTSAGPGTGAPDPGQQAADDAVLKLEKELKKVYGQAAKEMKATLQEMSKEYGDEYNQKLQDVQSGAITQAQFDSWAESQVKILETWQQKIDQCTGVMLNANQKAMGMVNGEMLGVFAENANWQSYQLTQDTKMNLMFSVYDEHTVEKLIRDKPELLPRKEVNGKKDKAWNRTKIANAVTQSILQGDSIPKLAKRIAVQTGETNMKAMTRYARTAMTSAQNSGRMEMLHRAKGMGIQCKKVWLATLDGRTRDAHGDLDGQKVDVDEPFQSDFGEIMYPGDLGSKGSVPANIYNCRCTLIYDYEGYPNDPTADQRLMYDEYDTTETDADGKEHKVHHRESRLITDMNYSEWKAAKEGSMLNDLNAAKLELAELQKQVVTKKIKEDKVYEGLWKDPVTLADYPAKKGGIAAKRDYYTAEIEKYNQAMAAGSSWATQDKIDELVKKRKLLNEFEMRGKLIEKRDAALKAVQDIYTQVGYGKAAAAPAVAKPTTAAKKTAKKAAPAAIPSSVTQSPFGPDAYTKERKDKALWAKRPEEADQRLRDKSGEVWSKASAAQRDGIYEYTQSYHKYNEPLRGIEYGTNRYLGVGKTDLDAGRTHNGNRLNNATDIISKSTYDFDMWLQRGVKYSGMEKFFRCDLSLLERGSQKELEAALLNTTPTEYAFMSCGSNKGSGLNVSGGDGITLNVYCPRGTQMMYVEPFSAYGGGHVGKSWDGKQKQAHFGSEVETLLQQGTQFRVTKVERSGRTGRIYIDMEVIAQDNQQRWKP